MLIQYIDLAPLTHDLQAKAVNVSLSLNSYKPKKWAYVTFNFQEAIDSAMKQTISFQDKLKLFTGIYQKTLINFATDVVNLVVLQLLPLKTILRSFLYLGSCN